MTIVTSADGKTLTIITKGKDGKGKTIDNVAVYEKQSAAPTVDWVQLGERRRRPPTRRPPTRVVAK